MFLRHPLNVDVCLCAHVCFFFHNIATCFCIFSSTAIFFGIPLLAASLGFIVCLKISILWSSGLWLVYSWFCQHNIQNIWNAPHIHVLVFLTLCWLQRKSYLFPLSPDASCVVLTLYANIIFIIHRIQSLHNSCLQSAISSLKSFCAYTFRRCIVQLT